MTAPLATVCQTPDEIATVNAAIKAMGQLVTLPEVAMAVVKLSDDPHAAGDAMTRALSGDPSLSARVLKIVNSAFYGNRREVTSISTAIAVLGFAAIKNIALAASLERLFRTHGGAEGFDPRSLWTHAIAVGSAARLIAEKQSGQDPNEAFLAGLMHDIGMIVALQACADPFADVVRVTHANPDISYRDVERELLGTTHEALGAALCTQWRFSAELIRITAFHHQPMLLPADDRRLSAIVYVADHVAAAARIGYGRTVDVGGPDADVLNWLGLESADYEAAVVALPAMMERASALMS